MWITLTQAWRGKPAGETIQVSKEVGELLIEQKLGTAAESPVQ